MSKEHGHGNRISTHSPGRDSPNIRKVPADSVPYGESISRNGKHVYAAYDGERLVCVAATAEEARRKYRAISNSLKRKGASDTSEVGKSCNETAANPFERHTRNVAFCNSVEAKGPRKK